jgi:hypothetical protein
VTRERADRFGPFRRPQRLADRQCRHLEFGPALEDGLVFEARDLAADNQVGRRQAFGKWQGVRWDHSRACRQWDDDADRQAEQGTKDES